jgi:hypothetical protein
MHNTNIIISVKLVYIIVQLAYKRGGGEEEEIFMYLFHKPQQCILTLHRKDIMSTKGTGSYKRMEKNYTPRSSTICTLHQGESIS